MAHNLPIRSTITRLVAGEQIWRVPTFSLPRRLMVANGIGIIAVVMNHSTLWGFVAMFWWPDSYRPVDALPDLTYVGSIPYYVLTTMNVLTRFSTPTFMFVSGFFMAYALRENATLRQNFSYIRSRLPWLLIPYVIWNISIFIARWLESCEEACYAEPLFSYVRKLLFAAANPNYYYVFVLVLHVLLAPLFLYVAKRRYRQLLLASWLLLFAFRILPYLDLAFERLTLNNVPTLLRNTCVLNFYFLLGLVFRTRMGEFKPRLQQVKPYLVLAIVLFALLALIDSEWYSRVGQDTPSPDYAHSSLFIEGYTLAIILSILTFERMPIPGTRMLAALGSAMYGIYLLHALLPEYLARAVHRLAPQFLAYPIALQLFLSAGCIILPFSFMSVVKRSPFKRYYRYLFG